MRPPARSLIAAALAGVALAGLSLPALGAAAPESLLPPGFGEPAPSQPAPPDEQGQPVQPAGNAPTATPADSATSDVALEGEEMPADAEKVALELPAAARRPVDRVGPLTADMGGLGSAAFGQRDGLWLGRLVRRLDAPVASRWVSMLLRRALLSRVPAPAHVAPADWVADRAALLLRMGEADAARMLVESVDADRFTPRLIGVAQQVALASGDPGLMCPLTDAAQRVSKERSWGYARAICASLAGEGAMSSMLLDRARGKGARDIDFLLAEKVVGAGANTRRTANIEWQGVDRLTTWRFGMAAMVGLEIPDSLLSAAGPRVQAWRARAPMYQPASRLGSARIAATLGVFSNAALVDLYGQVAEREGDTGRDSPAARLRLAYIGDDDDARMGAIRSFWEEAGDQPGGLYAAEILTARAAERLVPDNSFAADYGRIIASLLAAGLDVQAVRWAELVEASSPSIADDAWALLAVAAPRRVVDLGYSRIRGYGARLGDGGAHKMRMLVAALAGLGRLSRGDVASLADRYGLPLERQTSYTRALARATARREPGTVALLAAVGMQTRDWRHVPPAHLYHVVSALRRTGHEPVARMIAAEALSRL